MLRVGGLHVHPALFQFINTEVLPGLHEHIKSPSQFWTALERAIVELAPLNKSLLQKRDDLQRQIDEWHVHHRQRSSNAPSYSYNHNVKEYKQFLYNIGYIQKPGADFTVLVDKIDPEISTIAAPQLVVPLSNARYSLNASNARWGSLYDALYGSDIIQSAQAAGKGYNTERGNVVIKHSMDFLDRTIPLNKGSYIDLIHVRLDRSKDNKNGPLRVIFKLKNNMEVCLKDETQFVAYSGTVADNSPFSLLFIHNNLHIELDFDSKHPLGKTQPSSLKDVILESAVSTIQDCEDSVAVVDAEDKVKVYRNWKGLITGDLVAQFPSSSDTSKIITRTLNRDRIYKSSLGLPSSTEGFTDSRVSYKQPDGSYIAPGRSLLLIRNVGHHMYTDMVRLDSVDEQVPEGFVDAFVTSLIALYDVLRLNKPFTNSRAGSIYIVKPKQHGPEEVLLTDMLFSRIEEALNIPAYTIKMGIMDEERRTSVNLKECIRQAIRRVFFINTGFLDRTGDEIHTAFEAGPCERKRELKASKWIKAYESQNVYVGLLCGLVGKGQIGKGMWAEPDGMAEMLKQKISQPKAGASTAWVPSPTGATIHAIHYHDVCVKDVQMSLLRNIRRDNTMKEENIESPHLDDLLTLSLLQRELSPEEKKKEIENNIQGLLGYVVRWIDQGVGCSKVPDISGIGLMEDRATLRISSQILSNWLYHNVATEVEIFDTMRRMAAVVDTQNEGDEKYSPLLGHPVTSIAFQAAINLVFEGRVQPNGYTEFILHEKRRKMKQLLDSSQGKRKGSAERSRM